jgi:hypothetical protein
MSLTLRTYQEDNVFRMSLTLRTFGMSLTLGTFYKDLQNLKRLILIEC